MIQITNSPVAFSIGPVDVRWYGICVALAVMALVAWIMWQVKKGADISYDTVLTMAIIGIPAGIIFARFLNIIDQWSYYSQYPGSIFSGEGLAIYGAVLGAALAIWVYSRFSHFNYAYVVDVLTPGIILAQMIGRVGCTLNGCCYGVATSLPWGIVYTNPASDGYAASQLLPAGMGLQPTQVYEILFLGALFGLMMFLKGKLKPDGSQFLIYLTAYSLWRIGIDFIRQGSPFLFGLHQAQVIGIVTTVICVALLVRSRVHWARAGEVADVEAAPKVEAPAS